MLLYCSLSFLTSFVPCEINRPFHFKGYTYLTLHVMEEDNHTSTSLGEYVAIELTPKQQTVCVCVCACACACACVGKEMFYKTFTSAVQKA